MVYKTYKDWVADGYQVVKGAKSVKKNAEGVALFSDKQVSEMGKKKYRSDDYDDEYEHDRDDFYDMDEWGH